MSVSDSTEEIRRPSLVPHLAVVLPCHNEEEAVPLVVDRLVKAFRHESGLQVTALFVDDGSYDNTWRSIIEQGRRHPDLVAGVHLRVNTGKSRAQAIGITAAHDGFDLIAVLDADGQHDFEGLASVAAAALETGRPQIAQRLNHKRSAVSAIGIRLLKVITYALGIAYDTELAEFIVMPADVATRLVRQVGFGTTPLVPLVINSTQSYDVFLSVMQDHIGKDKRSRWSAEQLAQKALLHVFIDPWKLMIRLSIAVVLLAVVLGLYGLIVGISSIAQGSFMGIGSVIMVVVGTFMVLAVLLLAVIGLTVTQGIFTERQQLLDGVSVWRYVDDSGA